MSVEVLAEGTKVTQSIFVFIDLLCGDKVQILQLLKHYLVYSHLQKFVRFQAIWFVFLSSSQERHLPNQLRQRE